MVGSATPHVLRRNHRRKRNDPNPETTYVNFSGHRTDSNPLPARWGHSHPKSPARTGRTRRTNRSIRQSPYILNSRIRLPSNDSFPPARPLLLPGENCTESRHSSEKSVLECKHQPDSPLPRVCHADDHPPSLDRRTDADRLGRPVRRGDPGSLPAGHRRVQQRGLYAGRGVRHCDRPTLRRHPRR